MLNHGKTPQVKEVKPINFLFFRTETQLSNLGSLVPVAQQIFKEAVEKDLHITGPLHWHYFGFEGDATKAFTLEIALPVATVLKEYDGPFHFKRSESFKSVSFIHEGSWLDLPRSYDVLTQFITEHKFHPTSVNREIYLNADFVHPEANITEIQIGIN